MKNYKNDTWLRFYNFSLIQNVTISDMDAGIYRKIYTRVCIDPDKYRIDSDLIFSNIFVPNGTRDEVSFRNDFQSMLNYFKIRKCPRKCPFCRNYFLGTTPDSSASRAFSSSQKYVSCLNKYVQSF